MEKTTLAPFDIKFIRQYHNSIGLARLIESDKLDIKTPCLCEIFSTDAGQLSDRLKSFVGQNKYLQV